jgi:putative heme transporter
VLGDHRREQDVDRPDTTPDDGPDAEGRPRLGRQQIIAGILTLLILVLVFVVVIPQFGSYQEAWAAIQDMTPAQLGAIVIATVVLIFVYVTPYTAALHRLRFGAAFAVRQTSFMISNVLPAGGAFGLAIQYGMLQTYGVGPAPSAAAIGITGVWNSFITLSLPVVALVGLFIIGASQSSAVVATVIAAAAVVIAIVVFTLILRDERTARRIGDWASRMVTRAARLIRKDVTLDLGEALVGFRDSIVDVVSERWVPITVANLGQQLMQFLVLYLAIVAIQGSFTDPINVAEALAAFSFGRLATFIPIPPGGLGTTDAIITSILTGFGMSSSDALAADMVWRAATYFPQVIIGTISFLTWRRGQARKARSGT